MDKQTRSVIIQWIGPCILMLIVLAAMLFNFSAKSRESANDTVANNMTTAAQAGAGSFQERLVRLETVGRPLGELLQRGQVLDTAYAVELAEVAMQYSGAYAVYICDETGNGRDNTGAAVSIAQTDYFEQLLAVEDVGYLFTMDDGIKAQSTIIVSIPVSAQNESGNLLLYYPLGNFEAVVRKGDATAWETVTLIDEKGMVLTTSGTENYWNQGDDIYDELGSSNASAITRMRSRLGGHLGGMSAVNLDGLSKSLVFVPLGINDWAVVMSIDQEYIDGLVSWQWKNVRNMLYKLIAVIVAFGFVIVCINMISKIYNLKTKKQLEEKADTDLLTGLNNKLATERKIKEFIAKNPDSQSMMFILDIDNFKKINDTMGHAFGDEVLRSLGTHIGAIFRATDIVGRAGGDEFIVFLKNITDAEVIRKEAKKVEDFFKDFKAGEYTKYSATASIGVAIFPSEGASFESIYKAADQALYKAKKRGKNQLAFYNDIWLEEGK